MLEKSSTDLESSCNKTSSQSYITSVLQNLVAKGVRPLPLGKLLPDSPHAIFCSLPTLNDVIQYEEKKEQTCRKMQGGYPRFFNPPLTQKLEQWLAKQHGKDDFTIRLLSSEKAGEKLLDYLSPESQAQIHNSDNLTYVSFPSHKVLQDKVQQFLQHTGSMVFSRQAEDFLCAKGEVTQPYPENYLCEAKTVSLQDPTNAQSAEGGFHETGYGEQAPANTQSATSQYMENAQAIPATRPISEILYSSLSRELQTPKQNLFLSRCGMNAMFAAYQAISQIQRHRGAVVWIQLGWLYLDTMEILKKFAKQKQDYIYLPEVLELETLKDLLASLKDRAVAVVTEAPTNPLLLTPNLQLLFEICQKAQAPLILDTSLSGTANLDVLSHCDVLVCSLTKYHGWSGDLIMGLAALNPQSTFYQLLLQTLENYIDLPYFRDEKRLCYLMQDYPTVISKINENTMQLADRLQGHPHIKKIHWAYSETTKQNYRAIAKDKRADLPGAVVSFELNIPFQDFYDRIALPKGPSFGTAFSLLCPFLYLAHYDLIKTKTGRNYLQNSNISPELLRFSVGIEPIEELYFVFKRALL